MPDTTSETAVFGVKEGLFDPILDTSVSIAALRFSGPGWVIGGWNTLTLGGGAEGSCFEFNTLQPGRNILNCALRVGGSSTIDVGANNTLVINGPVTALNANPVYLAGGGRLELTGATIAAPQWILRSGDLVLSSDQAITGPSSWLQLGDQSSGQVRLISNGPRMIGKDIQVCAASNVGGTEILGGGSDDNSTFAGKVLLYNDLQVTSLAVGTKATLISGQVSGGKSLVKIGIGRVRLSNGGNSYTGGTFLNGGMLAVDSDSALGTGSLIFNGGTAEAWQYSISTNKPITINAVRATFTNYTTSSDQNGWDLSGSISGSGALTKQGNGYLTLRGNNHYQGGTEVLSGLLQVNSADALPPGRSLTIAAAGTVVLTSGLGYAAISAGLSGGDTTPAVPEPGTVALLASGLFGLLVYGWLFGDNYSSALATIRTSGSGR